MDLYKLVKQFLVLYYAPSLLEVKKYEDFVEPYVNRFIGSLFVNLINISQRTNETVDIESPVLAQSILFGCQLEKEQIERLLSLIKQEALNIKAREPRAKIFFAQNEGCLVFNGDKVEFLYNKLRGKVIYHQ